MDATTQRDRIAEAITREHYRRAEQRIETSPEEHGRAFADAAMTVMQTEPDQTATIARVKARCQEGRDGPYSMYTNVVKDDILDILDQPGEQVPDQAATIQPGQTLVLRYAHQISQADAATIKARLANLVPGVGVVVIDGCDQMIVYQPDQPDGRCTSCGTTHEECRYQRKGTYYTRTEPGVAPTSGTLPGRQCCDQCHHPQPWPLDAP